MKKLMMMSAGMVAIAAVAQEVSVPPPVVAVPPPVAVEAALPPPVVQATEALVELESGALCKTYMLLGLTKYIGSRQLGEEIMEKLETANAIDLIYDAKSLRFDAKSLPTHKFNVAVWEGKFEAKKAGPYVFTINAGDFNYYFEINDVHVFGSGQSSVAVNLKSGINDIKIVRVLFAYEELTGQMRLPESRKAFSIDYRLASSSKPAKPITPAMLKHVVEEEEEW